MSFHVYRYDDSFRPSDSGRYFLPDDSSAAARSVSSRLQRHSTSSVPAAAHVEPLLGDMDQMRSYRVEDTPVNFSAATSLSDLTTGGDDVMPPVMSGRMSVDSHDGLLEHKRNRK